MVLSGGGGGCLGFFLLSNGVMVFEPIMVGTKTVTVELRLRIFIFCRLLFDVLYVRPLRAFFVLFSQKQQRLQQRQSKASTHQSKAY